MLHFNDLKTSPLFKWSLDTLSNVPITCHTLTGNSEPLHSFINSVKEMFFKYLWGCLWSNSSITFTYD